MSPQGRDTKPASKGGSPRDARLHRWLLLAILAGSEALRVLIAVRGGQGFWTDEGRIAVPEVVMGKWAGGHIREGFDGLFSSADHLLFKVFGLVPALAERFLNYEPWVEPIFFGAFSVAVIGLAWKVVRVQGGSTREALLAAFLISACDMFFYYARHVFPYDLSLCFFLCAAVCASRPGRLNSFLAGASCGAGFLCYNGYWLVGGVVLILAALGRWRSPRAMVGSALLGLLGLLAPIAAVVATGRLLGHDLVRSYIAFSRTTVGDFGTAWRLVPEFYWASEHYLAVFWLAAFMAAAALFLAGRLESRASLWLAGALLSYAGMVGLSDGYHRFAVFARHTRPMAIFLCFLGAWLMERLLAGGRLGRAAAYLGVAGILLQFALNIRVPLAQDFPLSFNARSEAVIHEAMERDPGLYRVFSDGYAENPHARELEGLPMRIVYRRPHPFEFLPYTFDGFNETLRAQFRTRDISMRIVQLLAEKPGRRPQITRGSGTWRPYTGAVRLEVIFYPGPPAYSQPLISSGRAGAGDEVFVDFLGPDTIRLGLDDWGGGAVYSQPLKCDLSQPHVVIASFGALYPDDASPLFTENPQWRLLRHAALIKFDGVGVVAKHFETNSATPESIALFHNFIGMSTAEPDFQGRILSASNVEPPEVLQDLAQVGGK